MKKKSIFVSLLLFIGMLAACTTSNPFSPIQETGVDVTDGYEAAYKDTPAPITEEPTIIPTETSDAAEESTPDPTDTPAQTNAPKQPQEVIYGPPETRISIPEFVQLQEEYRQMPPNVDEQLEVPVYYEGYLFDGRIVPMGLGIDGGLLFNTGNGNFGAITSEYLQFAIRKTGDGRHDYYVMYDTDTGIRLYNHLEYVSSRTGIGVLVKRGARLLAFSEFRGLKVGDSIDDVCAVDPLTEFYKKASASYLGDPDYFNCYRMSSMHYLSDGILCIEYELTEQYGTPVIKNMIYSEDYILPSAWGYDLNYRILDIDLP